MLDHRFAAIAITVKRTLENVPETITKDFFLFNGTQMLSEHLKCYNTELSVRSLEMPP